MRKLIENFNELHAKINKIIHYHSELPNIIPLLNTQYMVNGVSLNFDRVETGDMEDYGEFRISSEGTLGKKLYHGESEGLYFVMAYDEDHSWDQDAVYIFDTKNKVE